MVKGERDEEQKKRSRGRKLGERNEWQRRRVSFIEVRRERERETAEFMVGFGENFM